MTNKSVKTIGIAELYDQYKDLISFYFPSKEEAIACEARAKMGDDRAIHMMQLVYALPVPEIITSSHERTSRSSQHMHVSTYTEQNWSVSHSGLGRFATSSSDDTNKDNGMVNSYNFATLPFYDSICFGGRSCVYDTMLVEHDGTKGNLNAFSNPFPSGTAIGKVYDAHYVQPLKADFSAPTGRTYDGTYNRGFAVVNKNDYRIEIAPKQSSNARENGSTVQLLYSPNLTPPERGDRAHLNWNAYSWDDLKHLHDQNNTRYIRTLETCAKSGDAAAARLLSKFYGQEYFYEYTVKWRMFSESDYKRNKHFSSVKAKEWQRVAEQLEGKGLTPIARDTFVQDFLLSQDKEPEGLYNIGYALVHNAHIADRAKGIDYLKHAANLDDSGANAPVKANAARELGEIYHTAFDADGNKEDLQKAYFWYGVAAKTPMSMKYPDGTPREFDGHPNAKVRIAYLDKAYPELAGTMMDENKMRNPSAEHIGKYPASAWHVEIPITDYSSILHDPERGGIMHRMEEAVAGIDDDVKEFKAMTAGIQAKIDDLAARQLVASGRVADISGDELAALRTNDDITRQQRSHERLQRLSEDRWVKETLGNLGSSVAMAIAVPYLAPALPGKLAADLANFHGTTMVLSNTARAKGYQAVKDNEVAHQQAIIDELESRKIDTNIFPDEIRELTLEVQRLADSAPVQRLKKDEVKARTIIEGCLRQKIFKSGLEVCRSLDKYAQREGIDSLDTLLEQFSTGDADLYAALSNLCYGHANSRDIEIILQDVHNMKGDDLPPHEKALKRYVERVMKGDVAAFITRASQIDVIEDMKLIDFKTMSVDHRATSADLVRGSAPLDDEEQARRQVEEANRTALTCMFSQQFGVTHIGQYDVKRIFSFYLHRHGRKQLIADELQDGQVTMDELPKRVTAKSTEQMEGFVERATRRGSNHRKEDEVPHIGDLFLRTCGYEYYLPQAVITSGRGNRFADNPESPVAYPMVNEVIQSFIQKLSLKDHATYQQQVGAELDNVIAQSFIDFFQQLGKKHNEEFAQERGYLRDAYEHEMYKSRFITYQDDITADAVSQFPMFLQLYQRNLKKALTIAPEAEVAVIEQQIASLDGQAQQHLATAFAMPGSHQARLEARQQDQRGSNMTESWRFAG